MAAEKIAGLGDEILDVAENLQRRIRREILLQVAVAAIHRTIAREVDDEIIAADLSVAAGAFLEELAAMALQKQPPLGGAEIRRGQRLRPGRKYKCGVRQRALEIAINRAILRAGLDDDLFGSKSFH